MTPELWHVFFVTIVAVLGNFFVLVVWDVYRVRAGKPTISHAFAVLGQTYQVVAPVFTAVMVGTAAGFVVHFWGP